MTAGEHAYTTFTIALGAAEAPGRWEGLPKQARKAWEEAARAAQSLVPPAEVVAAPTSSPGTRLWRLERELEAARRTIARLSEWFERNGHAPSGSHPIEPR